MRTAHFMTHVPQRHEPCRHVRRGALGAANVVADPKQKGGAIVFPHQNEPVKHFALGKPYLSASFTAT